MSLADRHCVRATKRGREGKDTGGEEDPTRERRFKKNSQKDFRKKKTFPIFPQTSWAKKIVSVAAVVPGTQLIVAGKGVSAVRAVGER